MRIDTALRKGVRGLAGGSSLIRLLAEQRGVRNTRDLPPFTLAQILTWADAHKSHTGCWPSQTCGDVLDASEEDWLDIDDALRRGRRGLPGRSSLARVLQEHRGVRNIQNLPKLRRAQIVEWARTHHCRRGAWPSANSGRVLSAKGEKWLSLDAALREGLRGLRGGSSVAQIVAEARGTLVIPRQPPLTLKRILHWINAHHQRTGQWPSANSGPVLPAAGETWNGIQAALREGKRGLPRGVNLAQLVAEQRAVAGRLSRPGLTTAQIMAWAQVHHQRTGDWPTHTSGGVFGAEDETWQQLDSALRAGGRGLTGGGSLARLLTQAFGRRNPKRLPALKRSQILEWADAHLARTGRLPTSYSGPVGDAPGETWSGINQALMRGYRGLPSGYSLSKFLTEHRR